MKSSTSPGNVAGRTGNSEPAVGHQPCVGAGVVVAQDVPLGRPDLGRRVDAEIGVEPTPQLRVHGQRADPVTDSGQGEHQPQMEPFVIRLVDRNALQVGDHTVVGPQPGREIRHREYGVDHLAVDRDGRRMRGPPRVVTEGRAAPAGHRLGEGVERGLAVGRPHLGGPADSGPELMQVEPGLGQPEGVARLRMPDG